MCLKWVFENSKLRNHSFRYEARALEEALNMKGDYCGTLMAVVVMTEQSLVYAKRRMNAHHKSGEKCTI